MPKGSGIFPWYSSGSSKKLQINRLMRYFDSDWIGALNEFGFELSFWILEKQKYAIGIFTGDNGKQPS